MTFTEILRLIKRNTGTQNTSSASYPIADQVVDVNNTLNWFFILANRAAGNWSPVDDTNQTDYPVMTGNLNIGQQDYVFTLDQNGNQILEITKVQILNMDGISWSTLPQLNKDQYDDLFLNPTTTSTPTGYYLTANGIFLVNPSSYYMTNGLKVYISRTSTYFTVSDTTKVAGIPWVFHEYLALRPSYYFCKQKGLPQAGGRLKNGAYTGFAGDLKDMEDAIMKFYRDRNKDFKTVISSEPVNPY